MGEHSKLGERNTPQPARRLLAAVVPLLGLIAVIGVSLVNIFLGSSMLQMLVSVVGVVVFAGLTAWDTQRLKSEFVEYRGHQALDKMAIMGALSLYLNLINMFQLLLGLMGQREE